MKEYKVNNIRLIQDDCFAAMDRLIEKGIKVDAVICDPTFGTTNRLDDITVPFNKYIVVEVRGKDVIMYEDEFYLYNIKTKYLEVEDYKYAKQYFNYHCKDGLWDRLLQLRKDKTTPIILMSNGMNVANLMKSNEKMWKYNWIWNKIIPSDMLNANRRPMNDFDDVCVFYEKQCVYNKQIKQSDKKTHGYGNVKGKSFDSDENNYNGYDIVVGSNVGSTDRNPTRIINITKEHPSLVIHSQQKPILLGEYFIKTYTNEGDTILDFMMGSGFMVKAANNLGRGAIGIDSGVCEKEKFVNEYKKSWAEIVWKWILDKEIEKGL